MDGGKSNSEAKDVLIAQLRREVKELSDAREHAEALRAKHDTLAHMHELLVEEKRRNELDYQEKQSKMSKTIASLRSEVETLTLRNSQVEYEFQNLQRQNDWYEDTVAKKNEDCQRLERENGLMSERIAQLEELQKQ